MFVRRRPLLRAAVVGGGAYMAGKSRARRQDEQAQMQADQDQHEREAPSQQPGGQPRLDRAHRDLEVDRVGGAPAQRVRDRVLGGAVGAQDGELGGA